MNFTTTYLLIRCDWNNKSQSLMFTHLLRTSPPAIQIFAVEVSVVVAVVLTTGDMGLSIATEDAVPISPQMQHLLGLPVKFVASPVTRLSVVTTDRNHLSRPNSPSHTSRPIPKVITPHSYCQSKTFGIPTPVQLTTHLQNLNLAQEEYHGQDQIRIGNGTGLNISHTGTAFLPLSHRKFILNQLFHVPSICKNLLSVRKFALDNSVFFEFHSSYFLIKDKQTGLLLHHKHLKDGLYQLLPSPSSLSSSSINQALVGERTTPASWHKRLGHPAFRTVQCVLYQFKLPVISNKAHPFCSACAQAKDINCHFIHLFLQFVNLYN
jgi:hypothetical protein